MLQFKCPAFPFPLLPYCNVKPSQGLPEVSPGRWSLFTHRVVVGGGVQVAWLKDVT